MNTETFSSPDIGALATAMLAVIRKLGPARCDSENPFVRNRYASLNSVSDACREALLDHGIWVAQYPVAADPGHLGLSTKLVHAESGQWQSSLMVMPLPKDDPQGYGSALTYARRYGLATLVGLVTELDDDAEAAMPKRTNSKPPPLKAVPDPPASAPKPNNQKGAATASAVGPDPLAGLPKIDGVTYQTITASNGRLCVTASGSTRDKRAFLQEAGFRWDAPRKLWWRYAPDRAA